MRNCLLMNQKLSKKAQTFSFDLLIALVVIGVVLAVVLAVIFGRGVGGTKDKVQSLETESTSLADRFVTTAASQEKDPFSFVVDNEIDQEKLLMLITKDYEKSKLELGMRNDFIIYFKEQDGSLSELKSGTGVYCYGSQDAYVVAGDAAVPCCTKVSTDFFQTDAVLNAGCLS